MLEVRMLGAFAISSEGQMKHGVLGSKGRRLAAYLITYPNRIHRRDQLTDLFWHDDEVQSARNALNTSLWRLRKIFGGKTSSPALRPVSVANEVILEMDDVGVVDMHEFERLARSVLEHYGDDVLSRDVGKILNAYNGPFLDGEDDQWIMEERERMHCLYVRVLINLMHRLAAARRYEDALECARMILREDPLREIVQRDAMLLYVLNGQQAEAIQQFERCRDLLWHECNVKPMPQTEGLADLIRSGAIFEQLADLTHTHFDVTHPI